MEEEDGLSEAPVRTSPRFSSKDHGKKNVAAQDLSDDSSIERPKKKMKFQTGGHSRKHKERKTKQNIGFKCCPHMLHDLFKRLDNDQKQWVKDLGFGTLLSMPKCRLPKGLTVWLINQVSWKRKALIIGGKCIKIKDMIKEVLGIPSGDLPVPLPRSGRGKSKLTNLTEEDKAFKDEKGGRGLDYKSILDSLISQHDPVQFKISFMLYALCVYFAPSSGHVINRGYIHILRNVEHIKDMNWCEHVAECLIEGIRDYRESSAVNVNVHGCVHVLLLIYIGLVRSPLIRVPEGVPRANHVDTDLLQQLDSLDLKHVSSNGSEYGKLEVNVDDFPDHESIARTKKKAHRRTDFSGVPPNTSSSTHSTMLKYNEQQLKKIEADYAVGREQIYEDCFKLLRKKMKDLDVARSIAIKSLLSAPRTPDAGKQNWKRQFAYSDKGNVQLNPQSGPDSLVTVAPPDSLATIEPTESMHQQPDTVHLAPGSALAHSVGTITGTNGTIETMPKKPDLCVFSSGIGNDKRVENIQCEHLSLGIPCVMKSADHSFVHEDRSDSLATIAPPDGSIKTMPHQPDSVHLSSGSALPHSAGTIPGSNGPIETIPEKPDCGDFSSGFGNAQRVENIQCEQMSSATVCVTKSADKSDYSVEASHSNQFETGTDKSRTSGIDDMSTCGDLLAEVASIGIEASQQAIMDARADAIHSDSAAMNATSVEASHQHNVTNGDNLDLSEVISEPSGSLQIQCAQNDPLSPLSTFQPSENPDKSEILDSTAGQNASSVNNTSDPSHSVTESTYHDHIVSSCLDGKTASQDDRDFLGSDNLEKAEALIEGDKCKELIPHQPGFSPQNHVDLTRSPDSPEPTSPVDVSHLQNVTTPIDGGEFFSDAGSVSTAVRNRAKRFGKCDDNIDGIAELTKTTNKVKYGANKTYAEHVEDSVFRNTRRKKITDPSVRGAGKKKILIGKAHVTEEEFVHALMPGGLVDLNFMWLCCVAIMYDWGSKSKEILDISLIKELMKPQDKCNHKSVARKLKKLRVHLDEIQQFYLPVCDDDHWILVVISITGQSVEIYDSLRQTKKGEHPYKDLWDRIGTNLQIAYSFATDNTVRIHADFQTYYPKAQIQTNNHDCGFEVIRLLECHNGKDLIGYGKKNIVGYRKEVAHILLYHRYNVLNPNRVVHVEGHDC